MSQTKIDLLKEAAQKVGSQSLFDELTDIEARVNSSNVPIMLPLVGEFSSGKTTLINALTDSKALETATKPTTATIFEIHFGAPVNKAEVLNENGCVEEVTEISKLKNDVLSSAKVVTVFDKSNKVSPYTILVDTPGISSPDPKHQQTLVEFLPQADAILLVIDINQQLTKSLSEFLKSASLLGVELNVVLTKSDTKSVQEIEKAKRYFKENCDFPIKSLVAVSAAKENLEEIYGLFRDIEMRKSEILKKSIDLRLSKISTRLISQIENMLTAVQDDSKLEEELLSQKQQLTKIQRQIDRFVNNVEGTIEGITRDCTRKFEDQISGRLSALINGKSGNYDAEAVATINSIAAMLIGEYRQNVMRVLSDEASKPLADSKLSLSEVAGIDLSGIGIQGLSYDLDLNSLGHEYDGWIKGGIIAVGAAAAVGAVVATGGAAAIGEVGTVVAVADTASDVGSIVANRKLANKMEAAVKYGKQVGEKYSEIDKFNNEGHGAAGSGKGMIDSLVGFISEKTMSKPQRVRAIRQYIDGSLVPEFKNQLQMAESSVVATVKDVLSESAKSLVDETTATLHRLQSEMKANKNSFEETKSELREIQTKLLTL